MLEQLAPCHGWRGYYRFDFSYIAMLFRKLTNYRKQIFGNDQWWHSSNMVSCLNQAHQQRQCKWCDLTVSAVDFVNNRSSEVSVCRWCQIIGFQLRQHLLHWMALNCTGAMEASLPTNRNKTILSRVLKVMKMIAIDFSHTSYIQDFLHSPYTLMQPRMFQNSYVLSTYTTRFKN